MSADPVLLRGAGAIGGVLGASFRRAGHDVLQVDIAGDHVEAMNRDGLLIEGPVEAFRSAQNGLNESVIADALARERYFPVCDALGREVMSLARAQDIQPHGFDPPAFSNGSGSEAARRSVAAMTEHDRRTAETHSGIWRDLAVRKRRTEVDAQVLPLTAIGAEHGVPTRALARLVARVPDLEAGRREQSLQTPDEMLGACA